MDDIIKFYDKDIGIQLLTDKTYEDGSKLKVFMFDWPHKGVQLHFIQPAAKPEGKIERVDDDHFTVKDYEDYMHSVHKEVIKSDICGFDQWFDNHYAYDQQHMDNSVFVAKAESMGYQYRWLKAGPEGKKGPIQVYIVDPTGFSVQFDGPSKNPPS